MFTMLSFSDTVLDNKGPMNQLVYQNITCVRAGVIVQWLNLILESENLWKAFKKKRLI